MLKICFYLSGNQRNFGKMSEIEQKCTLFLSILIFHFFFLDSNYLYKLFGQRIGPFFRFFVLYGREIHFYIINDNKFWKKSKKCTLLLSILIFQFCFFFSVFFGFQLPLQTFWFPYRAIFSIFCRTLQENSLFAVKFSLFC